MTAAAPAQATAFPEAWDAPVPGNLTFNLDMMHSPFPKSPLTLSIGADTFAVGFTTAFREYNAPIESVRVLGRNLYQYERYHPIVPANEDEARRMGELAEATLKPEVGRLGERWETEHFPAVRVLLDRMRYLDVASASPAEVVAALDDLIAIQRELWTIHFRIAVPMLMGMQVFDEFYADAIGGADGDSHALLTGQASKSVEAGLGLYDLAVRAQELGLEQTFRETPSHELHAALGDTDAGRTFLAELERYLDEFGLRQDLFDLSTPTWQEDPTFALSNIRNYIQTGRDARAEHAAMQRSAEDAIAAARANLANYPEAMRGQFEGLLQIGRTAAFLQEEHNFYIDQQAIALARGAFLRIGQRLADDGVLASPDDVVMLEFGELRDLFANHDPAGQRDRIRALVETRKRQFAQAQTMTPPPFIGPPPDGPPPADNPLMRGLGRFFGGPPQESEHPNELKGNAGSRGVVSGPAFVARTLEEANGLQPGQILVAVTTMPAWTPLFGVAAAVVTETGGPLSHCAIVAREYGIPAVVGAFGATRAIQTGQQITVDGGRGIVTMGER